MPILLDENGNEIKIKKSKYDYIKLRVNEDERALLEKMIDDRKVKTLSDAVHKLAFDSQPSTDPTDVVTQLMQEVAGAHQTLRTLIFTSIENGILHESEIIKMEREVAELSKRTAKLSRQLRKVK